MSDIIPRSLATVLQNSQKSILLLGPRQTGKSTLMAGLRPDITINLARESTYLEFASNPSELEARLASLKHAVICIDEVQRLPSLLNTIQAILDEHPKKFRFLLTGSSARKLKRGHANLLPGRIHTFHLTPLTCRELNFEVDIKNALSFGMLPGIVTEEKIIDKQLTLQAYAATYLKEEIQAEALTKNIEGFSRFIYVAAASATKYLDFTKLSSEASITRVSAQRYFEILEDTLIAKRLDAFSKNSRKRLIQHPRYFFFDIGVLNGLLRNFLTSPDRMGMLFEHFIFNQLTDSYVNAQGSVRLSSYRTEHGAEVDFILEYQNTVTAIEVKASKTVGPQDLRGLKNFQQFYGSPVRLVVLYLGDQVKKIDDIEILPWMEFFR